MTPPAAEVDLGRQLARRLVPATALIWIFISAVIPVTYYLLQHQALGREAVLQAEDVAEHLRRLVLESGARWRDESHRVLRDRVVHRGPRAIRVRDEAGRLVAEDAPFREWGPLGVPAGAAPLDVDGRQLGTVEVELSQRRLLLVTGWLFAGSTVLAAGLALFVYLYPVRILGGLEGRIRDLVVEVRRSNAELERQASVLQAKNAELDSFVYSVSHDLKAPLVAVEGLAGALLEDYGPQLAGDGRHYLERLQANVRQMEKLIQDLLALSRIGRESRPSEPVDLADLTYDVLTELADPVHARGVKVTVGELGTVWAIRSQLEQVMRNLLGNAVKYLGDTPSPVIEVGAIDRGGLLECYVRDNGIGIDPRYHEKIFEIFQRLNEFDTEGTGVGLAIVKKIVDGVGGRVWVESAKGEGATFRFTWPAGEGRPSHGAA